MEKNRLEATAGYLFRDFNTMDDFRLAVDYARELGWVVWENESRRMFFCRAEGQAIVVDYIRRKIVRST